MKWDSEQNCGGGCLGEGFGLELLGGAAEDMGLKLGAQEPVPAEQKRPVTERPQSHHHHHPTEHKTPGTISLLQMVHLV